VRLRLGTRGSRLALWQAQHVASRLSSSWPGLTVDIEIITTEGDRRTDVPLTASFGEGVFVKEIENALLAATIDLAVHSLKDLPTVTPAGLTIAAILRRHDPRDALVCAKAARVEDLPRGAMVATGSPRRRSQLLLVRNDLRFSLVRGNVDTRIAKLDAGEFDALILAVSGIERLGLANVPYTAIPTEVCLPAPGQGALAVETRTDDEETRRHVAALDDADTAACVGAERSFLAALGAGCLAPAGALGTVSGTSLRLDAMVGYPDGRSQLRDRIEGGLDEAEALGAGLASRLLRAGADAILKEVRG
jgi:hydroxymethylbilane synthase